LEGLTSRSKSHLNRRAARANLAATDQECVFICAATGLWSGGGETFDTSFGIDHHFSFWQRLSADYYVAHTRVLFDCGATLLPNRFLSLPCESFSIS
jgi:hypothetical protein